MILPSHLKSRIADEIIPAEIKGVFRIIEGEYHTIEDFKRRIGPIESKLKAPTAYSASALPTTQLTADTKSNSYESQTITLFNSTNKDQFLKITDYYLKPVREDVQSIILSSVLPYNDQIMKILEESALKMVGYIASQYPTLNSEEKALVRSSPIEAAIVFYNSVIAEQQAESVYPNSRPNGESDAFRHFVWSALLTRDIGEESAREFLHAHEATPNQLPDEKLMDEFNNELGIRSAKNILDKQRFDNAELYALAKNEINEGKLRIINKSGPKK